MVWGKKAETIDLRERPGWPKGIPYSSLHPRGQRTNTRTLCYGHRAARRQCGWKADTGNVSYILLFFICISEGSPHKSEIINITYICKHQSHSTCLSHVTQSPGPWGHSGCLPVPSAPAESHSSQVNWWHQGDSLGAKTCQDSPSFSRTRSISPCALGMAAGSCGQWGAEGSALPGLLSMREILGPWSGFSPPGLPAPLTDSYGLRGPWPCSLPPGPWGMAEESTDAYPSSPATSPWVSGEGEVQRRGNPWYYQSLLPNHESYITSFRPPPALWGASLVTQMVKNPPAVQEIWVRSLGWEDPLEESMATHSSILAWRIPWTEEPGRLQSMGSQRAEHNWGDLALAHTCECWP